MLQLGVKLTAQQRVDKAVTAVMGKDRYMPLAGILMIGERKLVDSLPPHNTAATNGRDEWYCKSFIDAQRDAQVRGLVIHESYHKAFRHLITWKMLHDKDPMCANMACDHYINIKITDENKDGFAELPDGGCCDFRFRGMNAAEIFRILYEEQPGGKGGKGGDKPCEDGEPGDGGGEPGDGQGDGTGFDVHDWDGAKEMSEEEQRELECEIDEAIRQGALVAGKTGTGGDRLIEELLEPQVDWRDVLRDFVVSLCAGNDFSTWRMPSKRYIAGGLYMPRGVSEQVNELVIATDMSGSTWNMVSQFLAETQGICEQVRPNTVRILYWDTIICRDEEYELQDFLDKDFRTLTKPKGGGGTTVQCVPDYMIKFGIRPQATVVLTDGELFGGWGSGWTSPVLWCICDNKRARPDNGKYVHITS